MTFSSGPDADHRVIRETSWLTCLPGPTSASSAGAKIHSLEMAAAAGDITGWPLARFTHQSRIRALVFAADHQRLDVIGQLIEAGTPVNEADAEWERLPLHTAAGNGRAASVRRLPLSVKLGIRRWSVWAYEKICRPWRRPANLAVSLRRCGAAVTAGPGFGRGGCGAVSSR